MMDFRLRRTDWEIAAMMAAILFLGLGAVAQQAPSRSGVRMPGRRQRQERPERRRPTPARPPSAPAGAPPTGAAAAKGAPPAPTAESKLEAFQTAGGTKMIRMELYNTDIDFLLRLLSREANVTIIKSEQVSGPITIIAPEPVPLDVAFQILNSVLEVRGFTMIRSVTGLYKVLPIADAIQSGPPLGFGARPEDVPSSDAFITQVIPLTNVDASDVAAQIQGLVSPNANIIPTSTNSIIITDTAASIQRVLTLVADTEAQLSGGLRVFSLRYYDAGDMSDLVTSLVLGRGGAATAAGGRRLPYERRLTARPGQPAQGPRAAGAPGVAGGGGPEFCYADTRTNSLIVLATPIHTQQIQTLIEQLDRPISLRDSFFVYPVQNLVASDLAQKIGPLINAQVTVAPTGGGGRALGAAGGAVRTPPRAGTTTPFGAPGYGITTPLRTSSLTPDQTERSVKTAGVEVEPLSGSSSAHNAPDPITVAQVPELPGLPVQPQPAAPPVQVTTQAPESAPSVPGPGVRQAVMTADDNTNTLLISASPEQLELVRQLLDQLDVSPPQVHIQAIIAEVSLTRNTSLGFQWESLGRTFGKFQGNPFTGDLASNFGESAPQKDASGNVTGPTGFSGQISGPLFHAVLNALTSDSHARILSAPSIFTSNNQPARIDVSNSRPFPTGTLTSTLGTGTAVSTSIQYQSVGIVLEVTPRVTQGDMVQMDVSVSADEVGQPVKIAGQEYPSTLARRANGNLIVKDGDTIILGGLMRDTINRTASRIPILGDLPIIGSLFRSTTSDREKSELLVFLTPHVVRGPTQATALTDKIKNNMMETPRSLQHPAEGSAEAPSKR